MQPLALNLFALISLGFCGSAVMGYPNGLQSTASQESTSMPDNNTADSTQPQQDEASDIMTLNRKLFNQMEQLNLQGDSIAPIWKSSNAEQSPPQGQAAPDEKIAASGQTLGDSSEPNAGSFRSKFQRKMNSVMQNMEQAADTINKKLDGFGNTDPGSVPPKT